MAALTIVGAVGKDSLLSNLQDHWPQLHIKTHLRLSHHNMVHRYFETFTKSI